MTTTATANVVTAVFRPGPKIQQPVSGGRKWTEQDERTHQKLRAEWKESKENVVTVVASSSAQNQRRVGNPEIKAGITGELIVVQ